MRPGRLTILSFSSPFPDPALFPSMRPPFTHQYHALTKHAASCTESSPPPRRTITLPTTSPRPSHFSLLTKVLGVCCRNIMAKRLVNPGNKAFIMKAIALSYLVNTSAAILATMLSPVWSGSSPFQIRSVHPRIHVQGPALALRVPQRLAQSKLPIRHHLFYNTFTAFPGSSPCPS